MRNSTPLRNLFTIQRAVRDCHVLSGSDRLLMDAIILRCNKDGKFVCWPSYKTLALDAGMSDRTMKRAANNLVKLGFIKRKKRSHTSNFYFVQCTHIEGLAEQEWARIDAAKQALLENPDEDTPSIDGSPQPELDADLVLSPILTIDDDDF